MIKKIFEKMSDVLCEIFGFLVMLIWCMVMVLIIAFAGFIVTYVFYVIIHYLFKI